MQIMNTDAFKWLKTNAFFQHMGFELIQENEEEIILKLPIKQELLNTNQSLHGGVHASMLETVQSTFLRSLFQCPVSAMNLDVHYFAPINKGVLYARAKLLQQGFKMATTEAEIFDSNHQIIAKGTGVYKILRTK